MNVAEPGKVWDDLIAGIRLMK